MITLTLPKLLLEGTILLTINELVEDNPSFFILCYEFMIKLI